MIFASVSGTTLVSPADRRSTSKLILDNDHSHDTTGSVDLNVKWTLLRPIFSRTALSAALGDADPDEQTRVRGATGVVIQNVNGNLNPVRLRCKSIAIFSRCATYREFASPAT